MNKAASRIRLGILIIVITCVTLCLYFTYNKQPTLSEFDKHLHNLRLYLRHYDDIYEAIDNNDLEWVKKEIRKYPKISYGRILFHSIQTDRLAIAEFLINEGADVNYNDSRITLLQYSIISGKEKASILLIESGAEVNPGWEFGESPLSLAYSKDWYRVRDLLIKRGAKKETEEKGLSPMQTAIKKGDREAVEVLLKNGVDPNSYYTHYHSPHYHFTALHSAARTGNVDILKTLIKFGANINARTTYGDTPLDEAIETGHKDAAKFLINNGADIYPVALVGNYRSPVFIAAKKGDVETLKLLLSKGAIPDTMDCNGRTPLFYAADEGEADAVKVLLDAGADINHRSNNDLSAICYSLKKNDRLLITMLQNGFNVNSKIEDQKDYLIFNSVHSPELLSLVVSKGANVNAKNSQGQSPLFYAMIRGYEESIRILKNHGAKNCSIDVNGATPLHYASFNLDERAIRYLVSRGFDINKSDKEGRTPIDWARMFRFSVERDKKIEETVNLLTSLGAIDNSKTRSNSNNDVKKDKVDYDKKEEEKFFAAVGLGNFDKDTPLHVACNWDNEKLAIYLINKGADITARNHNGEMPIHVASYNGRKKVLALLIKKGADVNADSKDGTGSPLYAAISGNQIDIMKILINAGANVNSQDREGNSLLHNTVIGYRVDERNNSKIKEDIINLLIAKGAKINTPNNKGFTPLHKAVAVNNNRLVEFLIQKGAKLTTRDNEGQTPLHIAIKSDNVEAATILIKSGADVSLGDNQGEMPVHEAAFRGNKENISLLLSNGAKIESTDKDGNTLLLCLVNRRYRESKRKNQYLEYYSDSAIEYSVFPGYEESARFLLKKGANVNARDKYGKTPLYYARKYGYMETAKIFEEYGGKE